MERVFTLIKRSTVGYRNIIQLITQFCIHFFFFIFHRYFSGSFSNYGIQEFFMILMIFKWSYQLINFYNYPLISFKKSRRLFPPFFSDILQCTQTLLDKYCIGVVYLLARSNSPCYQGPEPRLIV